MAIPKTLPAQRDFSAGQLDEVMARRDDLEIQRAGGLVVADVDLPSNSGMKRRPGGQMRYKAGRPHDTVEPSPGVVFDIVFGNAKIDFYDGEELAQSLTGFPWSAAIVEELDWVAFGQFIVVVHQSHIPQVVTYDLVAGTWSRGDYAFAAGVGAQLAAPFYRFANPTIRMQPSARTGSVTITFSSAFLVAGHVGTLIKWHGVQLLITAVASATSGTATVLDTLPPSYQIRFVDGAGFNIGDVIEGVTSGARGVVTHKFLDTTWRIEVVTDQQFQAFGSTEKVVGPTRTDTNTNTTLIDPVNSFIWEEQFMSDVRGWPGAVNFDRGRLIFTDFAQLTTAIIWSAIGAYDDLEAGDQADDAIFETVPSQSRVLHVTGGADEFVFTDEGVYYIPISADTPLAPGFMEFREIGTGGAAGIKPVTTNQGTIYVNTGLSQIMVVRPTGQTAQPYALDNVSRFHSDLIRTPVTIAAITGDDNAPGGILYIVNGDGTVVAARYDRLNEWVGFVPWNHGGGLVKWVSAARGTVLFAVEYDLDGGTLDTIEALASGCLLDGEITITDAGLTDTDYANETMAVIRDGQYDGTITVEADGDFPVDVEEGEDVRVGWNFLPRFVPFAQNFAGGESFKQRTRRRKVARTLVTVRNTRGGWRVNAKQVASWHMGENEEAAAPLRDRTYSFKHLGRSHDPQIEIEQTIPGAWHVIEVARDMTS